MTDTGRSNIELEVNFGNSGVILLYKGIINNNILSVFTKYIEKKISEFTRISRKINRVLIELAQNIAYYSEDRYNENDEKRGVGLILLKEKNDAFIILVSNKIKKEIGKNLQVKCNFINKLNLDELKQLRAKQRNEAAQFESRCNIGLIQVALISANKLKPKIIEIDDEYANYILSIQFDKFRNN